MFDSAFKISILIIAAASISAAQSDGCVSCHGKTDAPTMHPTGTVVLTCVDCHGGNGTIARPANAAPTSKEYLDAKRHAHPQPKLPQLWKGSANPVRPYTDWLKETAEYIQFV